MNLGMTIDTMLTYFSETKLAGSYFLLFLVSIVLLYSLNKEINVWFILYGIALLVVVVMNPIVVWALMQVFPALGSYAPLTMLIPAFLYVPFAATELLDFSKEKKIYKPLIVILIVLISVCGSLFGVFKDFTVREGNVIDAEETEIVGKLNEWEPELVLADEGIIQAISTRGNAIPLLYGRDLWTDGLDTGIMDGYNEEAYTFFDALKNSEENKDFIATTAYEYCCDVIIMDVFEDAPQRLGEYKLAHSTENYLVYRLVK
ncbi:MAG: hypothetical protein K6G69_10370 [Lachnospiraceae bacterium]|nr:hypothetical protein [Lachnospiraceae bacterium]